MDRAFFQHNIGGAPVIDEGVLLGVVSQVDISRELSQELQEVEVENNFLGCDQNSLRCNGRLFQNRKTGYRAYP